jgi:hypothetical protein
MLECLIIGDSIASGIASVKHECVRLTEIGITSESWYKKNHNRPLLDMESYRYVVISLGSNDQDESEVWMRKTRKQIKDSRVIWILPSKEVKSRQYDMVQKLASEFGDYVFDISDKVGKDKIHPPTVKAYEDIARSLR